MTLQRPSYRPADPPGGRGMRGALGLASRTLLAITALAGVVLIGHLCLGGQLSRVQFGMAVADLAGQTDAAWHALVRWQGLPATLFFLAGGAAGWVAALRWTGYHIRHRSLVIADLRHGDMPFAEGVRHVRANALPPVDDDVAATWLLLQAASHGRLTLWRRASADTLWRVPARHVRAATRMAEARLAMGNADARQALVLLADEVERLWPSRGSLGASRTGLSVAAPRYPHPSRVA